MKPLFLKVTLFDPSSNREFSVTTEEMDDIIVDIVPMLFGNVTGLHDPVRLQVMNRDKGVYALHADDFEPTDEYFLRVQFAKRMFSIPAHRLLSLGEVNAATRQLLIPTRLPAWDSGWDNNYEDNEFFGKGDLKVECSEQKPVELRVPLRTILQCRTQGGAVLLP